MIPFCERLTGGKLPLVTLNNPPEIRPLAPLEIDAVCRVLGLARLHQGNGSYLVAWDGCEPIGHAYLAMTDPPEMQDVEVRTAFQRRGTAHRLIAAVEAMAIAKGADRLRLSVSTRNHGAQALYRSLGFEDTGLAPRRVCGTIQIRTGPIEVDETMLTWEKRTGDAA
jgi:GNAT superfamily N-acetyltransferase